MTNVRENQDKWLEALCSGEYKQGKTYLHKVNGEMCCLGVAAAIFKPEDVVIRREDGGLCFKYNENSSLAPEYVQEALGITDLGSSSLAGKHSLAKLNDMGYTFEEIAAIFREHRASYTREDAK